MLHIGVLLNHNVLKRGFKHPWTKEYFCRIEMKLSFKLVRKKFNFFV